MEKGVDPSFFSKVLMESCCRVAARESVDLMKPVQILSRALNEVQSVHSKCYGKIFKLRTHKRHPVLLSLIAFQSHFIRCNTLI